MANESALGLALKSEQEKRTRERFYVGRRLWVFLRPYWRYFIGSLLGVIVFSLSNLLFPLFLGHGLIDRVLTQGHLQLLGQIAVAVIVVTVFRGLFYYLHIYLLSFAGQRLVADLRFALYEHMQALSLAFHRSKRPGDLISRCTNDVTVIQTGLITAAINMMAQALAFVGIIVAMVLENPTLSLIALLDFALAGAAVQIYGSRIRGFTRMAQSKVAAATAVLEEMLSGINIIKAFTMESREKRRFREENESSFNASMKSAQMQATVTPVVDFLVVVAFTIVFWLGGREVVNGTMTTGGLVAFISYLAMAFTPISSITRQYSVLQQGFAAAERVLDLLDRRDIVVESPQARELPPIEGSVTFQNVSFSYEGRDMVLREINLHVRAGEVVALVGPSGAGKSTLVNLIPRFFDPTSGRVLIDGMDIRSVTLQSLRSQIGLVPQETILFSGTVRENIAFGRPGASFADVVSAAKAANAHEFIEKLPDGYETEVGSKGASLSGGQRQRLAIARAILRDPRILIFDEATSSLDAESEKLVQAALSRLMKGRTTFVIAHRLSTVKSADRIAVIDNGSLVEIGTHAELLEQDSLYRRLYTAQWPEARLTETQS